jgi:hypothetical protein
MEAGTTNNLSSRRSLKEVITAFFNANTPDSSQVLTWKIFQCWTTRDCNFKSDVTNEEIAAFLDQLNLLVAAAYIEHQANAVSENPQQGGHP